MDNQEEFDKLTELLKDYTISVDPHKGFQHTYHRLSCNIVEIDTYNKVIQVSLEEDNKDYDFQKSSQRDKLEIDDLLYKNVNVTLPSDFVTDLKNDIFINGKVVNQPEYFEYDVFQYKGRLFIESLVLLHDEKDEITDHKLKLRLKD